MNVTRALYSTTNGPALPSSNKETLNERHKSTRTSNKENINERHKSTRYVPFEPLLVQRLGARRVTDVGALDKELHH
jgi:hypothetical protein